MNEFMTDIRDTFYELTNQDIPLAIIKTIEACWPDGKRPLLHKKKKHSQGWDFTFALPPGLSFREFCKFEEHFRDSVGDVTTEIIHNGKMAVLKVITDKIKSKYIYDFASDIDVGNKILPIPVGYDHNGLIVVDLAEVYNIIIAGFIGGGKSNSIHVITNSLIHLPKPPKVTIIDFKLVEYNYLSNYVFLVTDQDTARQTMSRLVVEMRNRLQILKQAECVNIDKFNNQGGNMDYIVLIIDELAELQDEVAQDCLETILRLGRAPGFRVILATQRPDSKIFGKKSFGACKANLVGKLCFQVSSAINSRIILDSDEAAHLPNIAGRAIWKYGKTVEVQTPYLDIDRAKEMLRVEQSAEGRRERFSNCKTPDRVGSDGYRTIANNAISFISRGAEKIKQIGSRQKN